MPKTKDCLVYILSSKDRISLDKFYKIYLDLPEECTEEESVDIENKRRQTIEFLDSLGFCEFDFDQRMVYMCPPYLVLLPTFGLPAAILVGARTPGLIKKMKNAIKKRKEKASLIQQENKSSNIPNMIKIESVDIKTLIEIADECGISSKLDTPAAWALANISLSFADIFTSLKFEKMQEPNWLRRLFSYKEIKFSKYEKSSEISFNLAEYTNPITQQFTHWLRDGERAVEIERNWGRYLALNHQNLNILLYDPKLNKMGVPVTVPLPCIIARAVSLCSGLVPIQGRVGSKQIEGIPSGKSINIYSNVSKPIVAKIAEKLGQKIIYVNLENNLARQKEE